MIDEKKLIEDLEEQYKSLIPEDDTDFCKIWQIKQDIKIIETQPQVGEWIPVSERLPEEDGMYLVTSSLRGNTEVQYVFYQKNIKLFICNGTPIAWMPLPEPYKGSEEECRQTDDKRNSRI